MGKTSLVKHFVHSIFSEKYHITIGVKIDKKIVTIDDQDIKLMLWDIAGEEEHFAIPTSYLKGSDGLLLVVDGTRSTSYDQAIDIQRRTQEAISEVPFVIVLNKNDLVDEWQMGEDIMDDMRQKDCLMIETSAKLGTGVEEAFNALVQKILSQS